MDVPAQYPAGPLDWSATNDTHRHGASDPSHATTYRPDTYVPAYDQPVRYGYPPADVNGYHQPSYGHVDPYPRTPAMLAKGMLGGGLLGAGIGFLVGGPIGSFVGLFLGTIFGFLVAG